MQTDLTDLLDFPREDLGVELKSWLDLDNKVVCAKVARHLAALANHGGGYLVIGFRDDLSRDEVRPASLGQFTRDRLTAIVRRHLSPAFQCEVVLASASDGEVFPIVRVPSHGATPVVAKTDGPHDARGRPQGITAGTFYIRKPGPESAPVSSAEDWHTLIRRCVVHDRATLLAEIAQVVQPVPRELPPSVEQRLDDWHRAGAARYAALLDGLARPWPVPIADNHCQLSYLIVAEGAPASDPVCARRLLDDVNREVRQTVWTGWSMFYPFSRSELAPSIQPERDGGTGGDVVEGNLLGVDLADTSLPDFWRFAPDGRATLIRPFREDRQRSVDQSGRAAGSWLSPETVIRETAELVAHARAVAERAEGAAAVAFRCAWTGLAGRELVDFEPSIYWQSGQIARARQRVTGGEWAVAALGAEWATVVAALACPVLNLFGLEGCGPELVAGMKSRFVKL